MLIIYLVTHSDFTTQSVKSGISLEDMHDESIKALTQCDVGSLVFEYHVQTSGPKLNLVWKKVVAAEDVKVSK